MSSQQRIQKLCKLKFRSAKTQCCRRLTTPSSSTWLWRIGSSTPWDWQTYWEKTGDRKLDSVPSTSDSCARPVSGQHLTVASGGRREDSGRTSQSIPTPPPPIPPRVNSLSVPERPPSRSPPFLVLQPPVVLPHHPPLTPDQHWQQAHLLHEGSGPLTPSGSSYLDGIRFPVISCPLTRSISP